MESTNEPKPKTGAKDLFLNLGAFISLYVLVGNLIGLLFTAINKAYPKITGYDYYGSSSISWPVATLIVVYPIFILLMWLLEREYRSEPERQNSLTHKWLSYITLLVAGSTMAGNLIAVLYYFIDGQELTTGFLLKVLVLFVIAGSIFIYFISDLMGKLTHKSRIIWRIFSGLVLIASIVWGFSVLGSPRAQQLLKYDQQKVSDLQYISSEVQNYYSMQGALPKTLEEIAQGNYYVAKVDPETNQPYVYQKTGDTTYNLCAEFNKASEESANSRTPYYYDYSGTSWIHPAGEHCFKQTIRKPVPPPAIY